MTELITLTWRSYPAAVLIALGLAGAVWSGCRGVARARRLRDPERALAIMQGFRIAIVCLALASIGAAWWWQIGWLFGLALVIGGQELLESTVVIAALKHGPTSHADLTTKGTKRSDSSPTAWSTRWSTQARAAASQRAIVASRSGGGGIA